MSQFYDAYAQRLIGLNNVALTVATIRALDVIDGRLYGTNVSDNLGLYESEDNGDTWTLLYTFPSGSALNAVRKLGDGEVLAARRLSGLWKSSGWAVNRSTATWSQVLVPNTDAYILPWGLDVYENVVIVTEYALPREPSRYVWISIDDGDTFAAKLDLHALYPGSEADVHWHGVCIDPWADGRLWASHGDGIHGMYYSDDVGETWTLLTSAWQPTAIAAGLHGIVCGTDEDLEGLLRILRTVNPLDMVVGNMSTIGITGWYGFANRAWRDPVTDLVYVSFLVDTAGLPAYIMVSNGHYGHRLYKTATTENPSIVQIMTNGSKLIGHLNEAGVEQLLRGDIAP